MADEKKIKRANQVYSLLCEMLDDKNFKYSRYDDDLTITFGVTGNDLPIHFILQIDEDREIVRLISPIPATFEKSRIFDGILATHQANYCLADGSFDIDIEECKIYFRMVSCYIDSLISKELLEYMIDMACVTIDEYNNKLFMLSKGSMTVEEFFKSIE